MDFSKTEKKWQKKWEDKKIFEVKANPKKKKFYVLEMYPYPSGFGLHMGHALNYTIGDIYARFMRMSGFNVLYPMGYDSFGLPAENAAIKAGEHPKKYTENSIKNFVNQQKKLGLSYDWNRMIMSHDTNYYKWNQFFFLKFLEKGLVYRKKAPVNWCSKCNTVLANEQVHNGKCWRHEDTDVETKELEQWFIKTTDYAEELLDCIDGLDWPERIKIMQKNWIGKSYGTEIDFEVDTPNDNISNVVIVHGSPKKDKTKDKDYIPDNKKAWIGWTKEELDKRGIDCICPHMPTPWKPKYEEWKKEFEKIKIDENSILVGTSAGGGFLVRYLGEEKKKVRKLILISPGKAGNSDRLKEFYGGVFYKNVKNLVKEKIVIYTSEDDHDYHITNAEEYAKEFDGKLVRFGKGYVHFTSKTLVDKDFPELLDEIFSKQKFPIFTTRPDTIFGVTFMVVSAQHPKLFDLVTKEQEKEVKNFLKKIKSTKQEDIDKLDKEGVFTGSYAINPVTKDKVPIYAGNFVIADYGSGMVMAVPAHDQRDFEFADKYEIPVKVVIQPEEHLSPERMTRAYTGAGKLINSGAFNGLPNEEAKEHIAVFLKNKKLGKKTIQYKLKDWLISRQRYWGTPIPVVYCDKCGIVPVPEKDLPVKLPDKVKFGKGNPLLTNENWIKTKCPKCGKQGRRETDTMDTFFDSSWYYLRYCDSKNEKNPFDKKKVDYWMPVNQYIGGAEHACMHLIYARFFTKALRDLGFVKFDEPFLKLFNQGMLHGSDGAVMSKSRGNVVLPETVSEKYGIDTARLFLVSVASPDKDISWSEKGIEGSFRFVKKLIDYFDNVKFGKSSRRVESKLNKTIKEMQEHIKNFRYNLAVINLRSLFDSLENEINKKDANSFLKLLHPFCPHITEELWEKLGNKSFISLEKWPVADEKKIDEKLEKQEEAVEKLVIDVSNILRILENKGEKAKKKITVFAIPVELDFYKQSEEKIKKIFGLDAEILSVKDAVKTGKKIKALPGKPGILIE